MQAAQLLQSWQNTTTKGSAEMHQVSKEHRQPATAVPGKLFLWGQRFSTERQQQNSQKTPNHTHPWTATTSDKSFKADFEMPDTTLKQSSSYTGPVTESHVPGTENRAPVPATKTPPSSLLWQTLNYPKSKSCSSSSWFFAPLKASIV